MADKNITFKLPKQPADPPLLRLEPFKGINLSVTPTQIDQHQASDMLNFNIDERGALNKRTGYEKAYTLLGNVNGMYDYRKSDGTAVFLIASGTRLYNGDTQIYDGLADHPVKFFVMNDKCYIMDGTNYLVYDGNTVSEVQPYIPTLTIARSPSGGGTAYEDFNLLGSGFKDSFSGDGTATAYQLSLTGLDATAVTANVDAVDKVEATDFTVDRTTGKVTFTTAPSEGTDNVIITAYKTFADKPNQIKNCTLNVEFGGNNDSHIFVSGNPNFPNWMWISGVYDPTYFPENRFYKVGSDAGRIQGFAKQYDYLVIEKSDHTKWNMQYELNNGDPSFPLRPINDQVGTIAPNSIQIVENNPVSLDSTGVYMLASSNVRNESNVVHLSANVDSRLLAEPNLENAISIDFDRKYWLCVNGNVYIFDYTLKEWLIYDNIHATCFLEKDSQLYFGTSDGIVYRFKKETDLYPWNDDGQPINTYWISKRFAFGADEQKKLVEKVFFSLKPSIRTSADLYYTSDRQPKKFVRTRRMDLFDYAYLDYAYFSYLANTFPQESSNKVKAKKVVYFQLEIHNNKVDESLGLLSLGLKFRYQGEVK